MRKRLMAAAMAALMSVMVSVPAFAGQWKQEASGWWYQNDDGTYPNNGWTWVDGKCYYFTPDGYCLMDTQTPDGYTVDASGAWIVDGVVQTQGAAQAEVPPASGGSVVSQGGLTLTVPEGFERDTTEQDGAYFVNWTSVTAMALLTEDLPELSGYESYANAIQEAALDEAMILYIGTPSAKNVKQFGTGTWYCYDYADARATLGIPGSVRIYARLSGTQLQMLMFGGNLTGMDTDAVMSNNLR